jgi:hypothetical protein
MSYPVIPCAYCNQPGHKANRCKQLGIPPDGEIIKPLPGQNDVDDDECELLVISIKKHYSGQKRTRNQKQPVKNKKQKYINTQCLEVNKRAEP